MAASPWAPLLALGSQRQVLLYNIDTLELAGVLADAGRADDRGRPRGGVVVGADEVAPDGDGVEHLGDTDHRLADTDDQVARPLGDHVAERLRHPVDRPRTDAEEPARVLDRG